MTLSEFIIACIFALGVCVGIFLAPAAKAQEPPALSWYCYPVDMKSGQQMCVRQVFIPTEP